MTTGRSRRRARKRIETTERHDALIQFVVGGYVTVYAQSQSRGRVSKESSRRIAALIRLRTDLLPPAAEIRKSLQ